MKNNTNIYDIDDVLIRAAGDNHKFTIQEIREKLDYYRKKYEETPDNDPKKATYGVYLGNLSRYAMDLYSKMTPAELQEELNNQKKAENLKEQIDKAINDLKKDIEDTNDRETNEDTQNEVSGTTTADNENNANKESGDDEVIGRECSNIHEERPLSQSDLLVERDGVAPTIMEEYVDYTEV